MSGRDECSFRVILLIASHHLSLPEEISRAQSESQRSFGSSHLLIEKYIENGKHIEVQIFGDSYGNVIALGERECSLQRRHQKIVEESPCAEMTRFPEVSTVE